MAKENTALPGDRLTRRILLGSLGAAGLGGLSRVDGAPSPEGIHEHNVLISGVNSTGDAGSLYSEIIKYANRDAYPLSFLRDAYQNIDTYRNEARAKILSLLCYSPGEISLAPTVLKRWEYPDYIQEKVLFRTTPWFQTTAYILIPTNRSGPRPAIVDLHSHGGMFVYGKEKVMPMPDGEHPSVTQYRLENYQGRSTSLALCKRGYVVVSIDAFYFGERRSMLAADLAKLGQDRSKYSVEDVAYLNQRAGAGEEVLAKSLFWAGTTWQGIVHWDDIRTVDYVATRPEVDPKRIGCVGISLGGYRSDFLAALEDRIQCAVSVGWMSSLRPLIKDRVITHSFMHFLPGLTQFLDLPDLAGCVAPKPLMVQECSKDNLYHLESMKAAVEHISAIYRKAGDPSRFQGRFYDEPHTFSIAMQEEAFDWLDKWLKP
jgi:dienelactone hydrolase